MLVTQAASHSTPLVSRLQDITIWCGSIGIAKEDCTLRYYGRGRSRGYDQIERHHITPDPIERAEN